MPRILIVDDEPGIRQSLKGVFEDEGFATEAVATGEECLEKFAEDTYDLVLLDIWLPVPTAWKHSASYGRNRRRPTSS